VFRGFI
jgi:hypothetical protein